MLLKHDGENYWIADLLLGPNLASKRQLKNQTYLFLERDSGLNFLITNSKPEAYFRVRHCMSRGLWQIRKRCTEQKDLWPYVYLYWRHVRGDEGYTKRRNLFNYVTIEDVKTRGLDHDQEVEYKINELMNKLYGKT